MRLLLDTCVCLWMTSEPGRLSAAAVAALDDPDSELLFSHVSAWEMCLKCQAGKLDLPDEPARWIADQIAAWSLVELPIDLPSLTAIVRLPDHHRDPFDRLLVSQARLHKLTLVTPDPWIAKYDVPTLW